MNNAQRLKILAKSDRTVFSLQNLKNLWQSSSVSAVIAAKRMAEKDLIVKLAKGYYSLNNDFNVYELANLMITPSYVSFNSALFYYGVAFQVSSTVSSVALLNYKRKIRKRQFEYFSMKDSLFLNLKGISYKKNLAMASPERAILDCFYFGFLPNIDNSEKINSSVLRNLSKLYPKVVQKETAQLLKKFDDKTGA